MIDHLLGNVENLEIKSNPNVFEKLYKKNIDLTKHQIKNAVGPDNLIMQTISSLEELDKVINSLSKRLREWYAYYNPELINRIASNEKLAKLVLKPKKETLEFLKIDFSMGADLKNEDIAPMKTLAKEITVLFNIKEEYKFYLEKLMEKNMPNLTCLAGVSIGAKLLSLAGSFKKLMNMPASTIQILGAEKALFRHLKTGAKPPKYGILHEHPLIQKTNNKAKLARALADKICIGIKVDYFKGEYVADKLLADIKKRFKN